MSIKNISQEMSLAATLRQPKTQKCLIAGYHPVRLPTKSRPHGPPQNAFWHPSERPSFLTQLPEHGVQGARGSSLGPDTGRHNYP